MKLILGVVVLFLLSNCEASQKDLIESLGKTASQYIKKQEAKRKQKFFCQTSPSPFETEPPKEKQCESFYDCLDEKDTLCCYWSSSKTSHCMKGLPKTKHDGECPVPTQVNDACIADYAGCKVDSQCQATEKCCTGVCGYDECLDVRQNIGCPHNFKAELNAVECESSAECELNEKCCESPDGKYCASAVSVLSKPGWCQWIPDRDDCKTDYSGECTWDSECPTHEKCCYHGCKYGECVSLDIGEEIPPPQGAGDLKKKAVVDKKEVKAEKKEAVPEKKEVKKDEIEEDVLNELVKRLAKLRNKE